ncbi:MAG: 2-dehydropantoate 2-reductase [Spirochaetales bacterium]|nr:2-dehydropantoate 2-reductase [Spirochaetales bacterium]
MNILVYGGGAVGLGIASCLIKAGGNVDIIARDETVALLKRQGLSREGILGRYLATPDKFNAYTVIDRSKATHYDYICVCVKSFDTEAAASTLYKNKAILKHGARIVLFQNGWGNSEKFFRFFGEECIYNARVITGFKRLRPNTVAITVHADDVHVGHLAGGEGERKNVEPLAEAIFSGDLPCRTVSDIAKDLWAKMLYNCPLNPLGAVLNVPYGILGEYEETRHIMNMIIAEVFLVMQAEGYSTHWDTKEGFIDVFYNSLIPLTKDHESSTLQDVKAGKRTEIDGLNGACIMLGKKHAIPVPSNTIMYNMVGAIAGISKKQR